MSHILNVNNNKVPDIISRIFHELTHEILSIGINRSLPLFTGDKTETEKLRNLPKATNWSYELYLDSGEPTSNY